MVHVAVPGLPVVTGVVPQPVFALHVTVPVTSSAFGPFGRPFNSPYSPLIVAVNVTDCPYADGLPLEVTTVPDVAEPTTCPPLSVPVLKELFESPEYIAVTVWVPTASVEVVTEVAEPELSATGEPRLLPSTVNCTVPVGELPVTVAVKLTA